MNLFNNSFVNVAIWICVFVEFRCDLLMFNNMSKEIYNKSRQGTETSKDYWSVILLALVFLFATEIYEYDI